MKVRPTCPSCRARFTRTVEAGRMTECDDCGEVFRAPAPPADAPDDDRAERPGPRDRDGDRDRDDRRPARPRPVRRESQKSSSGMILFLVLGGAGLLALAGGGVALLVWMAAPAKKDKDDGPAVAGGGNPQAPQVAFNGKAMGPQPGMPAGGQPVVPFNPPAQPLVPQPAPPPPPPAGPEIPPYTEPANPHPAGTQTKLKPLRVVKLPAPDAPKGDAFPPPAAEKPQFAYDPSHELLLVRWPTAIRVYDKTGTEVASVAARARFTDLRVSPDWNAAFAADYAGERTGYGEPLAPHYVHRFDPAARTWETRKAPKIAWRLEPVDARRVLLVEQDQWISVTLNKWEDDGVGIRELSRIGCDRSADLRYDPRTGKAYFGNGCVRRVKWDTVVADPADPNGPLNFATIALSQDGSMLYGYTDQVATADRKAKRQTFPEPIVAASRDIAFGSKAYYRASTGSTLGEYPFDTAGKADQWGGVAPASVCVSPAGESVWVYDPAGNAAHQFALEGGAAGPAAAPPAPPAAAPLPNVPPYEEPANPYLPTTQVILRPAQEARLPAPPPPADAPGPPPGPPRLAYSPKHHLLFVLRPQGVQVYDATEKKALDVRLPAKGVFSDLSLSPDESALLATEYRPQDPADHAVHRFDLAAKTWDSRKTRGLSTHRIEAVEADRFVLLSEGVSAECVLAKWEVDGVGVRAVARIPLVGGELEYDPRTGRLYNGIGGLSFGHVNVRQVGRAAIGPENPAHARDIAGAGFGTTTLALSRDGGRLYYGPLQLDPADPSQALRTYPEPVLAAARDVVFGAKGYYRADNGTRLGDYPGVPKAGKDGPGVVPFVGPHGRTLWLLDPETNVARRFTIEGEKAD